MLGFRVWDMRTNKMYTDKTVDCFNCSMSGSLRSWDASGGLCEAPNRFIDMQSTGLYDEGGPSQIEIFENDIVIVDTGASRYTVYIENVVDFLSEWGMNYKGERNTFTVLGNSLEDPELLVKVKC